MIPIGTDLSQYAFGPAQNFFAVQPGVPTSTPSLIAPPVPAPSPLAGNTEQAALQTLLAFQNGPGQPPFGSGPQATDVGPSARSAPSTGSLMGDARAAHAAGLTNMGLSIATNPAALATTVPATLAAAAINAMTGTPAKTAQSVMGLRGLATQLSHVPTAIRNAVQGLPDKPPGFSGQVNNAAKDMGPKADFDFDSDAGGGSLGTNESSPGSTAGGDKGSTSGDVSGDSPLKSGGLVKLAGGGVVPLPGGGKIAQGPGGGLDDLIPTSIDGQRAAALSDGEFVIPADVVSMMGDGSSTAGSRRLYDLVRSIREHKTGTSEQAGPLPVGDILKRIAAR